MKDRLKRLEKELMSVYAEIQKEIPALRHLTFDIDTSSGNIKPAVYGFYHIGSTECDQFEDIGKLSRLVFKTRERRAKKKILYQQFKGVA